LPLLNYKRKMKSIIIIVLAALIATFSAPVRSQAECSACTSLVTMIETAVQNNVNESEIAALVTIICGYVPEYQTVCDTFAESALQEVIAYIKNNEDPDQICTQLGFCSNVELPSNSGAFCTECEQVIDTVETWLSVSGNQKSVIVAVETICTWGPINGWEATCDQILQTGVPTAIEWISEHENSTIVCGQFNLCESAMKTPLPQDSCGTCEAIVTFIQSYVAANATQAEIQQYLNIACNMIPGWSSTCEAFVGQELPAIIKYLENSQTPSQVCTTIGLCSSKGKVSISF